MSDLPWRLSYLCPQEDKDVRFQSDPWFEVARTGRFFRKRTSGLEHAAPRVACAACLRASIHASTSSRSQLYDIERDVQELASHERLVIRQERARPLVDALHQWMTQQRARVSEGSAIARALDYSLRRWLALTRYLDDPQVPIDNNWCENQIMPIAIGKKNWSFAGSLRAGKRAAVIMSLVQSGKLNGHDPYAYLRDVLARLPSHPAAHVGQLLPHRWQSSST